MAVPATIMQDHVTKICWPLIIMVLIGLLYVVYTENDSGNSIFSNSDLPSTYSTSTSISLNSVNSENTDVQNPRKSSENSDVQNPRKPSENTEVQNPSKSSSENTEVQNPSKSSQNTEVENPSKSSSEISKVQNPGKSSQNTEIQNPRNTAVPLAHNVALALIHYATSSITPQQTKQEIMVTANILSRRGPCNFLVYGLGFDSPLWHNLNHGGRTVFLEEDPSWIKEMAKAHPYLEAYETKYTTVLRDAKRLLSYARKNRETCSPSIADLTRSECKLAIKEFPKQIHGVEWDVIMIDAPKGYFPEAPGRMGAIFSSAAMAMGPSGHHGHRNQKERSAHVTDVLLHDVDRPVEKNYAREFLCQENRVEAVGRLWHFQLSDRSAAGNGHGNLPEAFCKATVGEKES